MNASELISRLKFYLIAPVFGDLPVYTNDADGVLCDHPVRLGMTTNAAPFPHVVLNIESVREEVQTTSGLIALLESVDGGVSVYIQHSDGPGVLSDLPVHGVFHKAREDGHAPWLSLPMRLILETDVDEDY